MTDPKIAPRVDDDGVPWCDAGCPQAVLLDPGKNIFNFKIRCKHFPNYVTNVEHGRWGHPCPVWASRLAAENRALRECLSEAVDLAEDHDYKPDSFTTQPWRLALGTYPAATDEEE